MTTHAENERLAVLENQFVTMQIDVSEIKADVKALVVAQSALASAMAIRDSVVSQTTVTKQSYGIWVRSIVPWIIAGLALLLSAFNSYHIHT